MFANRISHYFAAQEPSPNVEPLPAFIVWPVLLVPAPQQAYIAEVYRRAQELTEAQLRQQRRAAIPVFSLN
jgi:hypothetical protein